ncbi:MAG: hypothetical protein IKO64_03290 [Kiritimatiellae bacterium]|nr:hypothetical protein [Kiritimatiellia bacterium]
MADRKLTVEVDADESKAKRKLDDLSRTAESSGGGGGNATLQPNLDKAAKSAKNFADQTEAAGHSTSRMVKAFSGMALGLAASYAKNHMEEGAARTAVGYAGSALSGASMGAMVGGVPGAVLGGAGGLLKEYLDNSGAQKSAQKDFDKAEEQYTANKDWQKLFKELTDLDVDPALKGAMKINAELQKLGEKSEEIQTAIARLKHEESQLVLESQEHIKNNELEAAAEKQKDLANTRGKLDALESAGETFAKQQKELEQQLQDRQWDGIDSNSWNKATNGLQAVGGNFANGDPLGSNYSMQQIAIQEGMLGELKKLNNHIDDMGGTF